jgi:hypothetical protein
MQQKGGDCLADDGQVFTIYEQKVVMSAGTRKTPTPAAQQEKG